jgi:Kelch motif/Galactose oxidase, central domain
VRLDTRTLPHPQAAIPVPLTDFSQTLVLVAGGYNGGYETARAELYDPSSDTWSVTGSLTTARWLHTATLLPNGQVLVTGGIDATNTYLASADLYSPPHSKPRHQGPR